MKGVVGMLLILINGATAIHAQLWQNVGNGFDHPLTAFGADSVSNTLYAAGLFKYSDTTYLGQVAYWDGNSWMPMDSGLGCYPFAGGSPGFLVMYDSLLFMGGAHFRCEDYTYSLHTWNGTEWASYGTTNGIVILELNDNELYAMGSFDTLANAPISRIGKWTGNGWEQFGNTTFLESIYQVGTISSFKGKYYLGGNFNTWPNPSEIAMWDGVQWSVPGGGVRGDSWVARMEVYDTLLWVAGLFDRNAGNVGNHVMTWDGTQWADPLPNVYFSTQVRDMRLWGGELYFQGEHYVYTNGAWQGPRYVGKYDGTQFCSFGGPDLAIQSMGYLNGRFFAGTIYQPAQEIYGYCAEWIGGNQMDFCVQQGPLSIQPGHDVTSTRLVVFPNPAVDQVEVHWEGDRIHELHLYDLMGRQMDVQWQHSGPSMAEAFIGHLSAGSYLLSCISDNGATHTSKITKR